MCDLAQFDIALCNHQYRSQYLTLLQQTKLSITGLSLDYDLWEEYLTWLDHRQLSIRSLATDNIDSIIEHSHHFQKISRSVQSLRIEWCDLFVLSSQSKKYFQSIGQDTFLMVLELPFLTGWAHLVDCFRLQGHHPLLELNLERCIGNIDDVFTENILPNLTGLQKLTLKGCNLNNSVLIGLPRYCQQLEYLDLEDAEILLRQPAVVDAWILMKQNQYQLTGATSEVFPELNHLNILRCHHFNSSSLLLLIENFPQIVHWKIGSIATRAMIPAMLFSLQSLLTLDLFNCPTEEIQSIIRDFPSIGATFPMIQILNLSNCFVINDNHLISIAGCCLDLTYCSRITDISLIAIAKCCPNLSILNISFCDLITDFSLITIAENCASLQTMILTCCLQITDIGIIRFAEFQTNNIIGLSVAGCLKITEAGMFGILASCKHLQILDVSDNLWMNNDLAYQILIQLRSLRKLFIGFCPNIGWEFPDIPRQKPTLQIIYDGNYE